MDNIMDKSDQFKAELQKLVDKYEPTAIFCLANIDNDKEHSSTVGHIEGNKTEMILMLSHVLGKEKDNGLNEIVKTAMIIAEQTKKE